MLYCLCKSREKGKQEMKILSVRYAEGKTRFSKHYHDAHQLLYVSCGSACVTFGERSVTLNAGTLVIFHRFDEHSVHVLSEKYCRYSILVSPQEMNEGQEDNLFLALFLNRADHLPRTVSFGESKESFEMLLHMMAEEYKNKEEFAEQKAELLFRQFLIDLYRYRKDLFPNEGGRNTEIVQKIRRTMENRYGEKITLADLASEHHVSLSHLTHVFKNATGYAPIEYLIECRLSAAKQMLSSSNQPITEIVELCGFSDESNFSRTFKKKIGMSPSDFRKKYRNQE